MNDMKSNFTKTAINFIVQATILALMCLGTIGLMFHSVLVVFASIAGMELLKEAINTLDYVFIYLAGGVWILSQAKMISLIVKRHGDFNVNTESYSSDWLSVFYPVIKMFYVMLALCITTIPGFVVGGFTKYFAGEVAAIYAFIVCTAIVALAGIIYMWTTRNDPKPWSPEYKNWLRAKKA